MYDLLKFNFLDIKKLNNNDLIEYKKKLFEYGEDVENYVHILYDLWDNVNKELEERAKDLEYQLALFHKKRKEEEHFLSGESGGYDEYVH